MADPASGHQTLLQTCPVHRCDDFDPPFYTLSRFDDVAWALRDIELFSSHYGQGPRRTEPAGMLCDPPQHTQIRKLVQQAFAPRAMRALRPRILAVTEALLGQILRGPETFDFHDDFAFPLPVLIIADLLGVPERDLDDFKRWSDIQVAAMGSANPAQYEAQQIEFFGYMQDHLLARRSAISDEQPVPDDLLTLIAGSRGRSGEFLNEADAQSVLMQLLVGGNETTTSLMTNLLWRLLEHPEQLALVRRAPERLEAAIEESLRYDPPVLGLYRTTTRSVQIHGETIPSGAKVYINYAAANRDASVFANPDVFNIERDRKRHMSFGLGTHFCLGAPMARLETQIAFKNLLAQMPDLELIDPGERIAPFFLWGRKRLPVRRC